MMQTFAIAISISAIKSLTLNLNDICHCSQLIQEFECLNSAQECNWDYSSKKCLETPCSEILIQSSCLQQSQRCYWIQGLCQNFTACVNLQGQNQNQCLNQNIFCPTSNGTNCLSPQNLQNCTSISTPNNCNNFVSTTGLCMWNGKSCIEATSCSQLYSNSTPSCDSSRCSFNSTNLCQPKVCGQYLYEYQCAQGISTFGPYLNNIIGCYWNQDSNECQDFDPEIMDNIDCYTYSFGTYHWDKKKGEKGDCVSCFQQLLIFSIIMIILI
ncbi:unnamed protein product [Paramecium sonneborni]|uniref:Uncharacterized protein n=1 Tax=Paramecium sonneborni TaxID=65129 RepID=A0A8S1NYI3_9CILI|nr:unnamed protein product [Paramecium sonneborni]